MKARKTATIQVRVPDRKVIKSDIPVRVGDKIEYEDGSSRIVGVDSVDRGGRIILIDGDHWFVRARGENLQLLLDTNIIPRKVRKVVPASTRPADDVKSEDVAYIRRKTEEIIGYTTMHRSIRTGDTVSLRSVKTGKETSRRQIFLSETGDDAYALNPESQAIIVSRKSMREIEDFYENIGLYMAPIDSEEEN